MSTSSISNRCNTAAEQKCGSTEILHVLVVDDSLIDRMLVERLLRSTSSCRVTTADSGMRALEILQEEEQKVNMIITDYCMPEMTGFDLLKRVQESSTLCEIPVVILSSENDPTTVARCMEEGAEEFLLKPLQKSDVTKLLNRMM